MPYGEAHDDGRVVRQVGLQLREGQVGAQQQQQPGPRVPLRDGLPPSGPSTT